MHFCADKDKKHYLCPKFNAMKKPFLFFLGFALSLFACTGNSDPLVGEWTAEKVNVQFDENRSTPELVKQIGEMEKQNSFSINGDSLLVFKGLEESWQGQIHLSNDTLYCDGTLFGEWNNGEIITRTNSPLGEIVVRYKKTQ